MSVFDDEICFDEWEEDWEEEEETTPENCSMGSFSPGTETCEFCSWRDVCEEEFLKMVNRK